MNLINRNNEKKKSKNVVVSPSQYDTHARTRQALLGFVYNTWLSSNSLLHEWEMN